MQGRGFRIWDLGRKVQGRKSEYWAYRGDIYIYMYTHVYMYIYLVYIKYVGDAGIVIGIGCPPLLRAPGLWRVILLIEKHPKP